jgi:preprotein translocase subunit SecD
MLFLTCSSFSQNEEYNGVYIEDSNGRSFTKVNDSSFVIKISSKSLIQFTQIEKIVFACEGWDTSHKLLVLVSNDTANDIFYNYTKENRGKRIAIVIKDKLIVAPKLNQPFLKAVFYIEGYSLEYLKELYRYLKEKYNIESNFDD